MTRPRAAALLVPLGFAAAAFLFWELRVIAPATRPEGFFQIDFYALMFPMYHYASQEIAAGRLPLWNPYTFCGIPFLATLYTGVLYPGNFLFLLLPTGAAMGATAALHTFLTAWFMFLLGRAWGWSKTASGAAGLTWAYSQNAVWFYGPLCFLASAAWIPLMALGIERACAGRRASGAATLAFSGAMSLLAGGAQTFLYGAYALAIIGAVRLWRLLRAEGAPRAVATAAWIGLGALTAGALAAPQLLPSAELARRTERVPGQLALAWADNPVAPVTAPKAPGEAPPEASGWRVPARRGARALADLWAFRSRELPVLCFGVLPPLLAVAALFGRRRGLAWATAAGAGVALLLSMGLRTPIYGIYHALPTGAWFRNVSRFAVLISLAMAALAGLGVTSLETSGAPRRRALLAACLAAAGGLLIVALGSASEGTAAATAAIAIPGLALLALASFLPPSRQRSAARGALILLLFAELFFAYRNPYLHPQTNPEVLGEHAAVSAYLRDHVAGGRVAVVDDPWGSWGVQSKYGLLQRIRTLNDFEPLTPAIYKQLFRLLDEAPPDPTVPFDGRLKLDPARGNQGILDLLGVRYVLVDRGLTQRWREGGGVFALERVPLPDPEVMLFENRGALARATLVAGAVEVEAGAEAAGILSDPAFDPRRLAVLQDSGASTPVPEHAGPPIVPKALWKGWVSGSARPSTGSVRMLRDDADRVEIEASLPAGRAAWLVLMDLNYPGWRATVDGHPARIRTANLTGRAIPVAAGTHRVTFRYDAPMFWLGCWIAAGAAGLWGLGALAAASRRRNLAGLARRVLPWLVALGILTILFDRAGVEKVRDAAGEADLLFLVGATLLCTLPMYLLDILSLYSVVGWFNHAPRLRDLARVKAAAYLVTIVNYNVGSGSIALWLKRRMGIPFLEAASCIVFINVVDALVLVTLMAAALPILEPPIRGGVAVITGVTVMLLAGHLLYWRRGVNFVLLGVFRSWALFKSFREGRAVHYLKLAAIRAPFDLLFIVNYWLALKAFGIEAPFLIVLAYVPIITFIAIVPITVAGLGTVQAATVFLFRDYAPEANLLALSLLLTLVMNGVRALLGLPAFRRVSEEIVSGKRQGKETDAPAIGPTAP
jgi:hypothetical protein